MRVLKEIYNYRQMIYSLVNKELKVRYKGSILGFFWTFLNPLLQLIIYTIVFSVIKNCNKIRQANFFITFIFIVISR